jgi:hypothetical protein
LITLDDCGKLKESVKQLINKWDPEKDSSCIFSTVDNSEQSKSQYFLDSADKISFFMEEDVVDPNTSKILKIKRKNNCIS